MSQPNYKISKKALNDLENIWLYTFNNWTEKQADRYYRLIIDEINHLSCNFYSGKSQDHIKVGYRSSKVKSHLIFYKKGSDGILEVIRVLHQMMDIPNRMK